MLNSLYYTDANILTNGLIYNAWCCT